MLLSNKENDFLRDLKSAEELCIEKYTRYSKEARCPELKSLFEKMKTTEEEHLRVILDMMAGNEPTPPETTAQKEATYTFASAYQSAVDKEADKFLLADMLATEKHVSSIYNTGVFEFRSPAARKMLSHIESEEQLHGEMIYGFMNANSMYH